MVKYLNIPNYILSSFKYNFYLGLGRSFIALGTLLTLLLNDSHVLFKTSMKPDFSEQLIPINAINIFLLFPDKYIVIAKIIACIILFVVAIGWRPRFTCIPHYYISACFLNAALDIDGGDQITSNLSLLLIPVLFFDSRVWHWSTSNIPKLNETVLAKNIFTNVCLLVIRLQMSVIYLHAFIGKLSIPEWTNGSSIYYWAHHPMFGTANGVIYLFDIFLKNKYILFFMTWSVLILEFILAIGLFLNRKHYKYLFIMGCLFHFSIIIVHGLFSFFFAMTGGLILYFLVDYYSYSIVIPDLEKLKTPQPSEIRI